MKGRVVLAGYNLDREILRDLRSLLEDLTASGTPEAFEAVRAHAAAILQADNWTPETLAAAYARVSRDPRSVTELRAIARAEVDKARRSNESIVFGLGHSSVAEHAVFNFDLVGISRLAVEEIERQRLASYTEKSQRYILLSEDWVLPAEIAGSAVEGLFRETVAAQHELYRRAYDRLLPFVLAREGAEGAPEETAASKARRRTLEGLAKEDARYALGLSTTVQLGETINARNLERLIARCRAHPLAELRTLADELLAVVGGLAPSLVKYTDPSPYLKEARTELAVAVRVLGCGGDRAGIGAGGAPGNGAGASEPAGPDVRLVSTTPDPDHALLAALLFAAGCGAMEDCERRAGSMSPEESRALALSHLRLLGPHDPLLREYEQVDLVYELIVSASCFAQLKRHRMATITALPYDPALGITIPDAVRETGLAGELQALAERSADCARRVASVAPGAAAYALTNAHRRRLLFKCNARELHHLARLREDEHAQWDIRRVAVRMLELARARMPWTLLLASGKDRFDESRRELLDGD